LLEIPGKSSLSGTNVARIVFVVFVVAMVALYMNALPKPPPADFNVTGFSGFDMETATVSPSSVQSLRVNSVGGFTGPVTLSLGTITFASGYTGPTTVTITLSATTVTVPSSGYGSADITYWVNAAVWDSYLEESNSAPSWSLTLTATGGGITHDYTITSGRITNMIESN
jgi:hypothetical protein